MANSQYELRLVGKLDTSQINKQIAEAEKSSKVTIKYNIAGEPVKAIQNIQDGLYNSRTIVSTLNSATGEWNHALVTVSNNQKRIKDEENQILKIKKQQQTAIQKNTNKIDEYSQKINTIKLQEKDRLDLQNKLNAIKAMDTSTAENIQKQSLALKKFNLELQQASKNSMTLKEQFSNALSKFAMWSAVSVIFFRVIQAVQDMINEVRELDYSLVELQKVTDLEGDSLKNFTQEAFKLGEQVGRTGKEVIDATTIFARSGYTVKEALDLSEVALIMTNVGDGIGDVEEAATSLISVLKAYNIETKDAMYVTDLLNQVSNTSAINFEDLTEGIKRTGAVYAQSGTSIEELAGLLTGTNEIMQNIEKSSSGLVTISQRLRGITELSDDGYVGLSKLSEEFEKVAGIKIYDQEGQLRDTYDILKDMAEVFPTLNENQRQYLSELAAGKRQVNVLESLLTNWESVEEAVKNASNATGSATLENEKFLNSIQGKLNQLKSEWQKFAADTISSDFVKSIVDLGTNILKLTNSLGGIPPILMNILSIMFIIKSQTIGEKIALLITHLKNLNIGLTNTNTNTIAASTSTMAYGKHAAATAVELTGLQAAISSLAVSLGVITAGISVALLATNKIKSNMEKTIANSAKLSEEYSKQADDLNILAKSYENMAFRTNLTKNETESLADTIDELSKKYNISKENLEGDVEARKKAIKEIRKEKIERMELAAASAVGSIKSTVDLSTFGWEYNMSGFQEGLGGALAEIVTLGEYSNSLGITGNTMSELISNMEKYIVVQSEKTNLTKQEQKQLEAVKKDYATMASDLETARNAYQLYLDKLKAGGDITDDTAKALINLGLATSNDIVILRKMNEYEDDLTESSQKLGITESEVQEMIAKAREDGLEGFVDWWENYKDIQEKIKAGEYSVADSFFKSSANANEYATTISNLDSAMQDLVSIESDINDYGSIQANTLTDLINNHADWLQYLEIENGELIISAANLQVINQLEREMAASKVASTMAEKAGASKELAAAYADIAKTGASAAAIEKLVSGLQDGGMSADEAIAEANKIQSVVNKILTTEYTMPKYSGKTSKKSSSSSKSKTDTWKEEFEKQYSLLKHSLNMNEITEKEYTDRLEILYKKYFSDKTKYLDEYNKYEEEVYKNRKKLIEEEIDSMEEVLKKQRELAENKYNNAIKVATSAIDDKIESLKKEKEALEQTNDEEERAIELAKLQEELERAKTQKTVRTFYADRGWVWETDAQAIQSAQDALDEFQKETIAKEQESAIDAQIDELQKLKEGWSDIASNYELQQNRIQAALEFGNNFEENVLNQRLDYLKQFVSEYNSIMDKLSIDEQNLVNYAASVGIDISGKYASGTVSARGGISLVGEKGAELRVLNKGDGIIPAQLTQNLMKWGNFDPVNYFREMINTRLTPALANEGVSSSTIYNFSNLTINSDANNLDSLIRDIQIKSKNR